MVTSSVVQSITDTPSVSESVSDIPNQVEKLKAYFATGKTKSYEWRVDQLKRIKRMTEEQHDRILDALYKDLGKCQMEGWLSETGFVSADVDHTLKHLKKWMQPRRLATPLLAQPGKSFIKPDALGTVLVIGAWNYPFQLVLAPVIAAVAAGNCAVLKPSELASHTSALMAELVPEYLDNQAFLVVEGGVEETTELLKLPFDHILYTGGETVGKIVMRAAAEHLTPVTLELGGKSPCIVAKDANLDVTAARIAWSKWMNAGQTCVAPDYVLVDKQVSAKLVDKIKHKLQAFYGSNPKASKDYGRIINARHFQRLTGYLKEQNVVHGGQYDAEQRFIEPTLVLNPELGSSLMSEEIFGPILPIIEMDDLDKGIALINSRPKPLALYLYTTSESFEAKVLEQTSAGSVCINDGMMFMLNPELPFGGVGNSGMGSYHGKYGFDTFSHQKAVMKRPFALDVPLRYPPFNKLKMKLLKPLI